MQYNQGMSYTDAAACKLLATHCVVCRRPLLDAVSVERGIGPDCFKKYMTEVVFPEGVDWTQPDVDVDATFDTAQKEANEIVYHLALAISASRDAVDELRYVGAGAVAEALDRLRRLGFEKLADKLEAVWVDIRISEESGRLIVVAPYHEGAVRAMRAIPGRRWDPARKVNTFPAHAHTRRYVWRVLQRFYAGHAGIGPKGAFVVTAEENVA